MSSTFFGLNIGSSALTAFQAAVNTTANNIANVQTEGYSRQTTTMEATQALRVTARYGSTGTGVAATAITQERNLYYDTKYWENNSSLGLYDQKLYYLEQIEDTFEDNVTQKGFATIFSEMYNALDTLSNSNADESVRNQFINQAQILCTYFNSLSTSLSSIQTDCNEEIKSQVQNVNAIGEKIAMLNKEINNIEVRGGYANELRDQRANLLDELSSIVSVETTEVDVQNTYGDNLGGTNFTVIINGQVLVDGNDYRQLECVSQDYLNNQNDIEGLYSVVWADTGMNFAASTTSASGSLKALFEIRDGNNSSALSGTVSEVTTTSITMSSPNTTSINELAIAEKGRITINNTTYDYDGWSAELDDEGNIVSVTFNLKEELDSAFGDKGVYDGKTIVCGKSVSGMGIPYYQQQINEFLRNFMEMFNDIEKSGVDLDNNQMGAFFVAQNITGTEYEFNDTTTSTTCSNSSDTYYQLTAANVAVNAQSLKNPRYFSTTSDVINGADNSELVDKLMKLQDDVEIFRGDSASAFLETLLSDVTVDTQKADIFQKNYSNLEASISNQRTSVSGVDEDEEALNLIKYQNAYNLASKVISIMSEMYSKLINETGVT
jgi:flagellar hook-associated protein 1 FlgK